MNKGTAMRHRPSPNGNNPADDDAPGAEPGVASNRPGAARLLVPVILIVTAVIVLRRMQRGNYA